MFCALHHITHIIAFKAGIGWKSLNSKISSLKPRANFSAVDCNTTLTTWLTEPFGCPLSFFLAILENYFSVNHPPGISVTLAVATERSDIYIFIKN